MKTYKVSFPLTITIEMDGADGPAMGDIIRDAIKNSFGASLGVDALANKTFSLLKPSLFQIDHVVTIRTAILDDADEIDVVTL